MSFFSRLVLSILPEPSGPATHSRVVLAIDRLHRDLYASSMKEVIAWHRAELEKFDFRFRLEEAQRRMMTDQEKARAQGIGPMDPDYPDLFDYGQLP